MESIMQAIRQYLNDPLISLIVATIFGAMIQAVIDRLQKKMKQIWWSAKGVSVLPYQESNRQSYKSTMNGLSIYRFVFWNNSEEIILNNDISSVEPLMLYFGDERKILEIRDISFSNPSIKFKIISSNQIEILFEYLENKQGATFDVIYTGKSVKPYFAGVIKGGKIINKSVSPLKLSMSTTPKLYLLLGWIKPAQQVLVIRWFSTIFSILILWSFLMTPTLFTNPDPKARWDLLTPLVSSLIIYGFAAVWAWKTAVVPVNLREFYAKIKNA